MKNNLNKHKNVLLNTSTARDGRASLAGIRGLILAMGPLFICRLLQDSHRSTSRARALSGVCPEALAHLTQTSTSRARVLKSELGVLKVARLLTTGLASRARVLILLLVMVLSVLGGGVFTRESVSAAPSETLNFQGRLLDISGGLVQDGFYNIEFNLYNASSGGSSLWTETRDYNGGAPDNRVRVTNGYFSVYLGDVTSLPNIDYSQELYLTMNIGGSTTVASWDGEMNPRFRLTAIPYAFRAANVASGDTNTASTNTNDVNITTGDALGVTSNSGDINIDTGTATGTAGTISLGSTNASALTLGRAGLTTTNAGALTVTQLLTASGNLTVNGNTTLGTDTSDTLTVEANATFNGSLTVSTGDVFTNAGATVFTAIAIGDLPTGGNIGTAVATVDVATTFNVNQTTASQTLTLPSPTNTAAGRLAYINNVGSAEFTMYGNPIPAGSTASFIWNGTSWVQTISYSTAGNILQGGNNFGTAAVIGTNDAFGVNLETNDTVAVSIDASQNTTFNGNVVIAAGQSLRLVGGNTASRPAGTAGELYYDTDTNTLLTYNGTKWVADRGEYVIVAANDSTQSEKDSADYVADGTSDEDEINSALTAAAGGKVILLAGTYVVDGTILIPNNTTFAGSGPGTVIDFTVGVTDNLIENSDTTTGTGIVIRDLNLDGSTATAGSQIGIYFNAMGAGTTRDGATITNVIVENFTSAGIQLYNSDNNLITESTFDTNGGTGNWAGLIIGSQGVPASMGYNNIISNNTFISNDWAAVYLAEAEYTIVSDNFMDGNDYTIYLEDGDHNSISGNTVINNGTNGIYFDSTGSDNIQIIGNLIDTSGSEGMYLDGGTGHVVDGNTIISSGSAGIYITSNGPSTVSDNIIIDSTDEGIYALNADELIISNNSITNSGSATANYGIDLSGDDNVITGNRIYDSSCTTTCYAIDISGSNNYLADNVYGVTAGSDQATINDGGTNTIFASQLTPAQVLQSGSSLIKATSTQVLTGSIDPVASTTVTGVSTKFLTELQIGDRITVSGETRTVTAIASDTSLTVDTAFSDNANDTSPDRLPASLVVQDSSGNIDFIISDQGYVGIGVVAPTVALDVSGSGAFTGNVTVGGTVQVDTLGATDTATFLCRNSSNILAGCNFTPLSSSLTDNITDALDIQEGTNNYININTTNGSEVISFGNNTTNPDYAFLGSGELAVGADRANPLYLGGADAGQSPYIIGSADEGLDIYGGWSAGATLLLTNQASGSVVIGQGYAGQYQDVYIGDALGGTTTIYSADSSLVLASGTSVLFAGMSTDITTNTNEDLSVTADGTGDVFFSIDNDTQLRVAGTVTDSGAAQVLNVTLGNDADADVVVGLQINPTSANTGVADAFAGLLINDVVSPSASVTESGIVIGSGYDYNLVFYDSSSNIALIDGGALNVIDDSGANTLLTITDAGTVGNVGVTGTLQINGLGTANTNTYLCRNSSNIVSGCLVSPLSSSLADNVTDALDIQEGTNNYININTTDSSENISFGNATTNPTYNFLGTGGLSVAGATTITRTGGNALAVSGAPTNSATSSLIRIGGQISGGNTAANGGTYIGLNAPSSGAGSTADFVNFQNNGTTRLRITSGGNIAAGAIGDAAEAGPFTLFQAATISNRARNATDVVSTFRGTTAQSGDLVRFTNVSDTTLSGFNASGNLFYSNSTFTSVLQSATLTGNRIITLPDATGTVALNTTGSATTGVSAFVQGGNTWGQTAVLGTADAFELSIVTNATEAIRIQSDGDVGIGTSSPGAKLEVDTDPGENKVALIIDQGDTTNNNIALDILNAGTGNSIQVNTTDFVVDGSGNISNAGTFTLGALGSTDTAAFVCRNTSNVLSGCSYTPLSSSLTDNITDAFDIQEGTNNYININTTDSSENISFGNATTNPSYNFLGSGTLTVAGLTTLNGGLTVEAGDTFTFNTDAFTDFTGGGLYNNSGVLSVDTTTSGSGFFQDGGNSFGATAVLGTDDGFGLNLETSGTTRLAISTSGVSTFTSAQASGGDAVLRVQNTTLGGELIQGLNSSGNTVFEINTESGGGGGVFRLSDGGGTPFVYFYEGAANYIDVSNGFGIGTNSPAAILEAQADIGDNLTALVVDQNDTTNNNVALDIQNAGTGNSLQINTNQFIVTSSGATTIQTGTNSTTAFEVLTSGGAKSLVVDTTQQKVAIGAYTVGSITGQLQVLPTNAARVGVVITGFSSQTANLLQFEASGGSILSSVSATGRFRAANGDAANPGLSFYNDDDTGLYTDGSNNLYLSTGGNQQLSVGSGGAALFQNSTDSAAAFQIRTSSGGTNKTLLNVDTSNELLTVSSTIFDAATVQAFTGSGNITQANIDGFGTILISSNAAGYTATLTDPTTGTAGRLVYVTNVGAFDMTLAANSGGSAQAVTLKPYTSATMVWNGSDWTAAGASSSTDLQAAYNNTATSAGGAELVLNASGGAADGLTIRNNPTTPIVGGILEVQSAIGTNLFSVNNFSTELAANGGAETTLGFSTNWSATGGSTVTQTSTAGEFVTGQYGVDVVTSTSADSGAVNNLASNPAVSTTHTVSFTAKLNTGTFTDLEVAYSPIGNAGTAIPCDTSSYSTRTLVTTGWTKITCTITTDATAVTNPDLFIRQEAGGTARTFWIDNLSFVQNDATTVPDNVQIGGGINGGPITLFTLDRASAPPVANGNETYLGSMYYDTTSGRIQCYEADGWGACGSAPNNYVNLTPEYPGSVLNGTGVGTMTADFCANESGVLQINTGFCASGESKNYYNWTSPQATEQVYSIYITYQLPAAFKAFEDNNTVQLTARTDNTTNGAVTYEMFRNEGGAITACGTETTVTSVADTWQTVGINGNEADGCGFTTASADNFVIFKINMKARSNANVYSSTLSFTSIGQ